MQDAEGLSVEGSGVHTSVVGATDGGCDFSDDEIDALLRAAAELDDVREIADMVGYVADLRTGFAVQTPLVGSELVAWLNAGHPLDRRAAVQRQVVDLNEIVDQLIGRH